MTNSVSGCEFANQQLLHSVDQAAVATDVTFKIPDYSLQQY